MAIDGIAERRATITRLKSLAGGTMRVFKGIAPEGAEIPRDAAGRIVPHLVVDFGAPIQTARDRTLAYGEKGQPHLLPANIACISGDSDWSEDLLAVVIDKLVDWAPSTTSDPWELKGGYGSRRPASENTPIRYVEGVFLETVVNQGIIGA